MYFVKHVSCEFVQSMDFLPFFCEKSKATQDDFEAIVTDFMAHLEMKRRLPPQRFSRQRQINLTPQAAMPGLQHGRQHGLGFVSTYIIPVFKL